MWPGGVPVPGSPIITSSTPATSVTPTGPTTVSQAPPPGWGGMVQPPPHPSPAVPRLSPSSLVPPPAHSGALVQPQPISRLPAPTSLSQSPAVSQFKPGIIASAVPSTSNIIIPGLNRPIVTGARILSAPQVVNPVATRPSSLTVVAPVASVGLATTSSVSTTTVCSSVRPVTCTSMEDRGSVVRAPVTSVPHSVLTNIPHTPPTSQDKPPIKIKTEADVVRYSPGIHHPALRPAPIHGYPPQLTNSNSSVTQPPPPSTISAVPRVSPATSTYAAVLANPPPSIQSAPQRSAHLPSASVSSYPPAVGIIKPEQIKREPELSRPEKLKYEHPPVSSESFKLEIPKHEPKLEIKQERNDRPEIIAEIKSEPRPEMKSTSSNSSVIPPPASLASLPAHLPIHGYPYHYSPYGYPLPMQYPYPTHPRTSTHHRPQSPSQRPSSTGSSVPTSLPTPGSTSRVSPCSVSMASVSSTLSTSSSINKPTPAPIAHAPPPHLSPVIFSSRPGVPPHLTSPSKLPASQPSPLPPGLRPPGPASGLPGVPPGLPPGLPPGMIPTTTGPTPLPTPPAAHTGPVVKPPSLPINLSQPPVPAPGQPPTTQALPATVPPSHPTYPGGPPSNLGVGIGIQDGDDHDDDDDLPVHREPSPEPKIEDSEFHRSESAIFLRHWNRGEFNSCTRTDLTFKPVPNSQLARKREERLRKQAEKEREERERIQRKASTPDKRDTPKPSSSSEGASLYERMQPRNPVDTPALSRLGEYARSPVGLSPGVGRPPPGLGLPPGMPTVAPGLDRLDLLHYGGSLGSMAALYPAGSQERLELEARERDLRDLRERELTDRLKQEMLKRPLNPADPAYPHALSSHWLSAGRFPGLPPPVSLASGFPHSHALYPPSPSVTSALIASERDRLERLAAAAAAASYPPRPPLLRPGDPPPPHLPHGYPPQSHHAAALLGRPYEELVHISAAHEQLQRQMLMERERFPHLPGGPFRP